MATLQYLRPASLLYITIQSVATDSDNFIWFSYKERRVLILLEAPSLLQMAQPYFAPLQFRCQWYAPEQAWKLIYPRLGERTAWLA